MATLRALFRCLVVVVTCLGPGSTPHAHALYTSQPPVLQTDCGAVQGAWTVAHAQVTSATGNGTQLITRQIVAYRGITYAEQKRWQPPVPVPCWQGTLNATACLTLNVFTRTDTVVSHRVVQPVPVFVWIHGGDSLFGDSYCYGPIHNLLADMDIVLVTLNYRVNAFGFLALEVLSNVDPRGTSGNYGLMDQQEALRWIQRHISSFGGDPTRVTLIGQSTGGTSIFGHLSSPASASLFTAGIALSGSVNISTPVAVAAQRNRVFLNNTGCNASTPSAAYSCLMALSPEQVIAAIPQQWDAPPRFPSAQSWAQGGLDYPALWVVDGVTVPERFPEGLARARVDKPVIVQNMAQEVEFMLGGYAKGWNATELKAFLNHSFAAWGPGTAQAIEDLYRRESSPSYAFYSIDSDIGALCASANASAQAAAAFVSPVYLSVVTAVPAAAGGFACLPGIAPNHDAFHVWDIVAAANLWHFCGNLGPLPAYQPTRPDVLLGQRLRSAWMRFAANYGHLDEDFWPPASRGVTAVWAGAGEMTPVRNYRTRRCTLYQALGIGQSYWWSN